MTPDDPQAFTLATNLARRWLVRQSEEQRLPELNFSDPVQSLQGEHARLFVQSTEEVLSFAFAHDDERDSETRWHVLGALEKRGGHVQVVVEVSADTSRRNIIPPIGMPAFLAEITEAVGLEDVWSLTVEPRTITTDNAADFVAFLRSVERQLPVVAFSQPLPMTREEVDRIARRVAGAAHVVVVNVAASFVLSEQLGRTFSVFQGAVRAYPPKLPQDPYKMPLYFPATVQRINAAERLNGPFGRIRFADVLVREALSVSSQRTLTLETVPEASPATEKKGRPADRPSDTEGTVPETKGADVGPAPSKVAHVDLTLATTSEALAPPLQQPAVPEQVNALSERDLRIAEMRDELEKSKANENQAYAEIESLEERLEQYGAMEEVTIPNATEQDVEVLQSLRTAFGAVKRLVEQRSAAEAAAQSLRDEMDDLRRDVGRQRLRIESLERREPAVEPEMPQRPDDYRTVKDLERYLEAQHGQKIVLHDNARHTLENGLLEDSTRVIDALDLLGTLHYDMKTGAENGRAAFTARLEELRLKYSRAISDESVGHYGRHYAVTYEGAIIDPREIWHVRDLSKNYTRERMMGIYFFWDDDREATVITSGPRKLPTPADGT